MKKLIRIFSSVIDAKIATLGAVSLGVIVFWINREHGWQDALTASLKQAVYTFFFGGFVVRICGRLAKKIDPTWLAGIAWTLVPVILTVGMTFLIHSLRGTPEPFYSTLPTALSAPISFFVIGYLKRRNARKKQAQSELTESELTESELTD